MSYSNWGKMLMVGFKGTKPSDDFLRFIEKEKIGSVILFSENYESLNQLILLNKKLREVGGDDLLIAVDQEGGRVARFGEPFTKFLAMKKYGDLDDVDLIKSVGKTMGAELSAAGMDWNLAPVLDVNTNSKNPVIGDRSFGVNPELVSKMGIALMKGLHEGGVLSCGKHFPGHGDASLDSHETLPKIDNNIQRWKGVDLIPFKSSIDAGIPSIMTAHILAKSIDDKAPASISHKVISDLLRKELGFKGVVVSDDLNMKGISNLMQVSIAAKRAIEAGSDMVIIREDLELQKQALESIKSISDKNVIGDVLERIDALCVIRKSLKKTI